MSFYEISDLGSHPSSRSLFKTEQKIELTTEKKINYKDGRTVLMKKSGFFFHLGFFFNFGVFLMFSLFKFVSYSISHGYIFFVFRRVFL